MPEERYEIVPIGHVRSTVTDPREAPRQGREAGTEVTVDILPPFREALAGIAKGDALLVVCWFHRSPRDRLRVHPRGNPENPTRGVFATRSPHRPNPLAVYRAEVVDIERGGLRLRGIDAVDGTPVIDIRPHRPYLDD